MDFGLHGQLWIPRDEQSGLLARAFVVRANEKLTAFLKLKAAI
jgi:hypothetical protein